MTPAKPTCMRIPFFAMIAVCLASTVGCSGPPRNTSVLNHGDQALVANAEQINRLKEKDFITYDASYRERREIFGKRLVALASKLASFQGSGSDMTCSTQIYLETKWLYDSAADWVELDRQLVRLADSLRSNREPSATSHVFNDGAWGTCYDQWFLRSEAMLAALEELYDSGHAPSAPIMRPEPINTPKKLEAYLNRLLVSDIAKTGRDNRAELGGITTTLSEAIFKRSVRVWLEMAIDPLPGKARSSSFDELEVVYDRFIRQWQDPETGYWGAWYRSGGQIYKTTDLSITYHTIAYRDGQVNYWPQIIDTTLRISDDPYPYGWLHDGHFTNHNNYDVARILRYGWPHMTTLQKQLAREAISRMLDWTLEESLGTDGTFKIDPTFFSSLAADYYFGVSFLDAIGFWDRTKRFWTNVEFSDAANVCRRITARLVTLQLDDYLAVVAQKRLNASCGPSASARR